MHIEFLVEEESAEEALENLVPRIVGQGVTFKAHVHQGKRDLLSNLPGRLKGYKHWLPEDWLIVVLVDAHRQDCLALKCTLEQAARDAGLITKTASGGSGPFQVLNRIVMEQLEAWFFGDVEAMTAAYPRLPASLGQRPRYRNPDSIVGGTAQALERELERAGYHRTGPNKIITARDISRHMQPERNCSKSFRLLRDDLKAIISRRHANEGSA